MKTSTRVAQIILLGMGGLLLVLGVLIWTGQGGQLVGGVHVALGMILVLTLWALAAIAARSGVSIRTVALAASYGFVVLAFGLTQEELLPGDWHWTIQVTHVAISMGAIWWGRRLVSLMRRERGSASWRPEQALPTRSTTMEMSRHA
jgi:hypothetical protein